MSRDRQVAYEGKLLRVEHQIIPGRHKPYEFIRRIGATVVLPVLDVAGKPHILGVVNTRAFYGTTPGLAGGNAEGDFDNPEHPTITGLRELREETGYGYPDGTRHHVDTFLMRAVSTTILYDRSFSVVRDVEHVGGEVRSPHEVIELAPVPVDEYLDPIFGMRNGNLFPEINLAIAKAGMEVGRDETTDWIVRGAESPYAEAVISSFEPWMAPTPAAA